MRDFKKTYCVEYKENKFEVYHKYCFIEACSVKEVIELFAKYEGTDYKIINKINECMSYTELINFYNEYLKGSSIKCIFSVGDFLYGNIKSIKVEDYDEK